MTLLVGVPFPWDSLLQRDVFRVVAELGFQFHRGVILAADSRWTRPSGARVDDAIKIFGIGTNGLAAYGGNVPIGEDAIKELSVHLPGRAVATIDEMNAVITQALQTVWARYSVFCDRQLHVLLGLSDAHGGCWLGRFSHQDDFRAHPLTDIELIGPEPAKNHFRQVFDKIVEQQFAGGSYSLEVRSWAGLVATALHDTCEREADVLVGGKILYGVTSGGEAEARGFARVRAGLHGPITEHLTVHPLQARTLRKWWKCDGLPAGQEPS